MHKTLGYLEGQFYTELGYFPEYLFGLCTHVRVTMMKYHARRLKEQKYFFSQFRRLQVPDEDLAEFDFYEAFLDCVIPIDCMVT